MTTQLPAQFGPYTLLKLLARGGMGEIYLARTVAMNNFEKYYAIKKLLKKFAHDNDVGARFVDEAKLGARLQHPNIVQVYDLGAVNDELYMATEFVDGFDLRRVLRYCHEKKKRIPLDVALFVVREILSGLAYAHRQVDADGKSIDLIHRDISPQNVLVSFEGEVKIIDFGLAKSTQRSQETQANVLLGNFGYMSPEQARGHKLDVRTDVYSAGIVLFELTTGTKRFVDDNPLRLLEMVARPTPIMPSDRLAEIPGAINQIYAQATAPPRENRYGNAETFRDEVTTALHRINPKAGREHLAQFLTHLFLGGAPPPPVDPDLLDKSVMIQVKDLVAGSAAFQASQKDDVGNRSLTNFSDDAPQTGSHDLMRSARVGDKISHEELIGIAPEDAPPPMAEASFHSQPRSDPAAEDPTRRANLIDSDDDSIDIAVDSQEKPMSSIVQGEPVLEELPEIEHQSTAVFEAPAWSAAPVQPLSTSQQTIPAPRPAAADFKSPVIPVASAPSVVPSPPATPPQRFVATAAPPPIDEETLALPTSPPLPELLVGQPLPAEPPAAVPLVTSRVISTVREERDDEPEPDEPTMVVDLGEESAPFGEGAMMESLIIDFDAGEADGGVFEEPPSPPELELPPEELQPLPPPPQSDPNLRAPNPRETLDDEHSSPGHQIVPPGAPVIRPAAQPLGRIPRSKTKPLGPTGGRRK